MRRRYPVFRAIAAQLIALLVVGLLAFVVGRVFGVRPPVVLGVGLQALVATWLGHRFGLAGWWLLYQAAFGPTIWGLHRLELPPGAYLAAFLLVLLSNWNSFRHGVPLYLTSVPATRRLEILLGEQPVGFSFIDLGCGLAGPLDRLGRAFPHAQFTGVETAPLTFALAWLRCLPRGNCRIRYRSLWQTPLAPYDVVYCFLSPLPMSAVWEKMQAEHKPGAMLVSNTFGVPGVSPDQTIALSDWRGTRLLVWKNFRAS